MNSNNGFKENKRAYISYIFITILSMVSLYYLLDGVPDKGLFVINALDGKKYMVNLHKINILDVNLPSHIKLPHNGEKYYYLHYLDAPLQKQKYIKNNLKSLDKIDPFKIIYKDGDRLYNLASYNKPGHNPEYITWNPFKKEFTYHTLVVN